MSKCVCLCVCVCRMDKGELCSTIDQTSYDYTDTQQVHMCATMQFNVYTCC